MTLNHSGHEFLSVILSPRFEIGLRHAYIPLV